MATTGNNLTSPDGTEWTESISDAGAPSWAKVGSEPPVEPETPDNPGWVDFSGKGHKIDGTDIERQVDFLVRYTTSPTQANEWGVDVTLDSSTNVVLKVNRRISTQDKVKTPFDPATQYVLSGHGQGGTTAGQFLIDNATVGAHAVLSGEAPDPPPVVEPPVVPPQQSGTFKLQIWEQAWTTIGAGNWDKERIDVVDSIALGIAQSSNGNHGFVYPPINPNFKGLTDANHREHLKAARAKGIDVLVGVGGAGSNLTLNSQADVNGWIASAKALGQTHGVNGIAFDLEASGSSWTEDAFVLLDQACKANNLILTVAAQWYGEWAKRWLRLGARTDHFIVTTMEYDYPEAVDDRIINYVVNKTKQWTDAGLPASRFSVILMPAPDRTYHSTQDPATAVRALQAQKKATPGVVWTGLYDDGSMASRDSVAGWNRNDFTRAYRAAGLI